MMTLQQQNISDNNFESCIKCTICTVYCPVTAVNPDYPGPKQAGPDGERYRLKKPFFYDEALKYCLNCKRCEVACPNNVKIGDIIQAARIKYSNHKPSLRDTMLASTDFMGSVATAMAPVVNFTLGMKPVKYVMDKTLGIDRHRTFPKYASTKFETWYRREAAETQKSFPRQVSYFHGCYVNYNYPQLGKDLVKVMNALGYGVRLLDSHCCGIAGTYGFKKENYEYSQGIGEPLFRQIRECGCDFVASDCETCKWQIEMSTGIFVLNPISILAEALE